MQGTTFKMKLGLRSNCLGANFFGPKGVSHEDPQLLNQKISEIVQDCIIIDPPHVEGQNAFKFNPGQPIQSAFRNQQPCNQQVTMIDTTSKQAPVSPIQQQQGSNLQQFIQQRVPPVLPQQQQNNMQQQQQQWQQMQQQRAVAQAPQQVLQRPIVTAPVAAPIQQQQVATSAQTLQEKIKQQLLQQQQQQQQNKPQVCSQQEQSLKPFQLVNVSGQLALIMLKNQTIQIIEKTNSCLRTYIQIVILEYPYNPKIPITPQMWRFVSYDRKNDLIISRFYPHSSKEPLSSLRKRVVYLDETYNFCLQARSLKKSLRRLSQNDRSFTAFDASYEKSKVPLAILSMESPDDQTLIY